MSYIADLSSIGTMLGAVVFAAWMVMQLFKKTADGQDVDTTNPLYTLLHDAPNAEWTSYAWRKYSMQNVLTFGRAFTFIERNKAGRVMNLWPLNPGHVTVRRTGGKRTYELQEVVGQPKVYQASEIIDLPFMLSSDGVGHIGPVSRIARAIGLAIALESYAEKFFLNGGVPPLALYGPVPTPGAASRAAANVTEAVRAANSERRNVLIMPAGHELKPVGVDPDKSQMEASRRFQVEEIARVYGLPPSFLQDLTNATFSNVEQQDLNFTKHSLTHWLELWEQELNLKLFTARNRGGYCEFNVDGLLRGDFATRMDGMTKAVNSGLLTPNEGRALDNRPAMPGGEKLYIQGATVPLTSAGVVPAKPANDNAPATGTKTGTK